MGEHRGIKPNSGVPGSEAIDPVTGLTASNCALVIGRSAGERESVARAVHRFHRGQDGPFLRVQCGGEAGLLRQALQSWLAGPSEENSPPLLSRLEGGSLYLDGIEALELDTQQILVEFLDRSLRRVTADDGPGSPGQLWKGQLIVGSERSLRTAVSEGRFLAELADRLEKVRIVLDPEDAEPET
jgi:DNA-binding NtrC family response regulator